MAKGKHATALFEVMNKSRQYPGGNGRGGDGAGPSGGGGGGLPTPKWWFKSRNAGGGGSDVRTIAPGAVVETPVVEEPAAPAVVEEPVARPAAVMMPPLASSIDVPPVSMASPAPRVQPVAVSLDPDKQQISLRLSYTSALIGGFSVFIALGLAVLVGKSLSRGPSTAIANTSTQVLRQRPPTPGVMNVGGRRVVDRNNNGIDDAAESANSRSGATSTGTHNPQQSSFNDPRPPATFFTDDPHRSTGLNYAIIQSYPDKEKEMAEQAAAFLTKNGIPCTVEQHLPNWRIPSWPDAYMVVGIRGFAKVSNNPALEAYKKQITNLSAKYTGGRAGFKAFAPTMYSWKKSN